MPCSGERSASAQSLSAVAIRHPFVVSLRLTSSSQFALAQGRQGCGNSHCFWVVRVLALCFAVVSFPSVLLAARDAASTLPTATTFDVSLANVVCSLRPRRCLFHRMERKLQHDGAPSHGQHGAPFRPAQPALSCILPTDTIFWPAVSKQG